MGRAEPEEPELYRLVDSEALALLARLDAARRRIDAWLCDRLAADGHPGLTPAALAVLAQLDGGANHAASLARHMGISRQAVHKTLTDLAKRGLVAFNPDPQNRTQKLAYFTGPGERLMRRVRAHMRRLDAALGPHRDCIDRIARLRLPE